MDVSGSKLNSAVLDAASAQVQTAAKPNRPAPNPVQQPSAEVTLSRDARDRAAQAAASQQQPAAANVAKNPVQPTSETQAPREESRENTAVKARENESRQQQSENAATQSNTPSYSARVAAQSYARVSNI